MSAPQEGDKSAAFSGLILGGLAIFVIVFAIVRLTNSMYANKQHEGAAGAREVPAATTPAAGAPAAPTAH
jgi:hypothetical protein